MTTHTLRTWFLPTLGWIAAPQAGLAAATLMWAGNFVMGRALRGEIEPLLLNFCRWVVAALVLAPFVGRALVQQWPILRRRLGLVAALGFSGIALPHACTYQAVQTTSAVNALLMLNLVPLVVALGAWRMFGQPLRCLQWGGLVVALGGAVLLLVGGDLSALLSLRLSTGDLWMLPAVFGSALHFLLLKKTPAGVTQGPLLLASIAAAVLMMAPALPWVDAASFAAVPRLAPNILYIGVFASAAAFFLWTRGVAAVGPNRAAPFVYLMPVYGSVLSTVFIGEPVTAVQVGAGALVLSGLWMAQPAAAK